MADRRRYDKRTKLAAVMAAEMGGVTQASEQLGIPKNTIQYWLERPEFAQFRTKTREELQGEIKVVAHLAWQRLGENLQAGLLEPRDVIFAAEKATDKLLLMGGEATTRTESRSLLDDYDDHERAALKAAIDRSIGEHPEGAPEADTGDVPMAGSSSNGTAPA